MGKALSTSPTVKFPAGEVSSLSQLSFASVRMRSEPAVQPAVEAEVGWSKRFALPERRFPRDTFISSNLMGDCELGPIFAPRDPVPSRLGELRFNYLSGAQRIVETLAEFGIGRNEHGLVAQRSAMSIDRFGNAELILVRSKPEFLNSTTFGKRISEYLLLKDQRARDRFLRSIRDEDSDWRVVSEVGSSEFKNITRFNIAPYGRGGAYLLPVLDLTKSLRAQLVKNYAQDAELLYRDKDLRASFGTLFRLVVSGMGAIGTFSTQYEARDPDQFGVRVLDADGTLSGYGVKDSHVERLKSGSFGVRQWELAYAAAFKRWGEGALPLVEANFIAGRPFPPSLDEVKAIANGLEEVGPLVDSKIGSPQWYTARVMSKLAELEPRVIERRTRKIILGW